MDKKSVTVELKPITEIAGATYNPRVASDHRSEALKKSLQMFGWLIPAYINEDGTLLSGHQRTTQWRALGGEFVPVVQLKNLSEKKQRSLNILFNLATNDMSRADNSEALWDKFKKAKVGKVSKNQYPCATIESVPVSEFTDIDVAEDGWQYAKSLYVSGVVIPIVLGKDGKIANGKKRIVYYIRRGMTEIPCVRCEDYTAEEIGVFLNYISMDFNIRATYENELRYGSFRRPRVIREALGHGFSAWLRFKEYAKTADFDHTHPLSHEMLRERFGDHVVDFGAGHLHETRMMEACGISMYPFEPYHVGEGDGEPNLEKSRELAKSFLDSVASGQKFDSIILSSVFNSVPFVEDRRDILAITSALGGILYLGTMSRNKNQFLVVSGHDTGRSERSMGAAQMKADYEDGVIVGDLNSGNPKAQKFFYLDELKKLVGEFYNDVKGFKSKDNLYVIAKAPKVWSKKFLTEALMREFDLPYSDNRSLGLGEYAVEAFKKRGLL